MPTTTRATPASISASAQGGVRPWWEQGSSVVTTVAPPGLVPAAARATTSRGDHRAARSLPRTRWPSAGHRARSRPTGWATCWCDTGRESDRPVHGLDVVHPLAPLGAWIARRQAGAPRSHPDSHRRTCGTPSASGFHRVGPTPKGRVRGLSPPVGTSPTAPRGGGLLSVVGRSVRLTCRFRPDAAGHRPSAASAADPRRRMRRSWQYRKPRALRTKGEVRHDPRPRHRPSARGRCRCSPGAPKGVAGVSSHTTTPINVHAGKVVAHQGTHRRELIVIVEGTATVSIDGHEVATLGPGDFVGEMPLLDGGPRSATVTAEHRPRRRGRRRPGVPHDVAGRSLPARSLLQGVSRPAAPATDVRFVHCYHATERLLLSAWGGVARRAADPVGADQPHDGHPATERASVCG